MQNVQIVDDRRSTESQILVSENLLHIHIVAPVERQGTVDICPQNAVTFFCTRFCSAETQTLWGCSLFLLKCYRFKIRHELFERFVHSRTAFHKNPDLILVYTLVNSTLLLQERAKAVRKV